MKAGVVAVASQIDDIGQCNELPTPKARQAYMATHSLCCGEEVLAYVLLPVRDRYL
jgi:hypothetical protein